MQERMIKRLHDEVFEKTNQDKSFALQIGVLNKGRVALHKSWGKDYKFFDLASLTKVLLTADYFAKHPDFRTQKVTDFLPWLGESKVQVSDLLNHSSNLPAHIKFFKDLKTSPEDERTSEIKKILREKFKTAKSKSRALYSDLDFILLGFVVEEIEGCSLEHYFERENETVDLHFNRLPFRGEKSGYAPSEICPWRQKTLRGEVLDGNAHFMGGVGAHAGLFGSLDSVLDYGKSLRKAYKKNPGLFKAQNKEWASGFMIPSGPKTTAGKYFSKKSIGHLGYTGTSLWFDPEADLFITILSNRTHPDRHKTDFNKFRPVIQDIVYEETILNARV